jgi:hypothetical protein
VSIEQGAVKVEKNRGSSVHSKAFYKKGSVARLFPRLDRWKTAHILAYFTAPDSPKRKPRRASVEV